MNLLDQNGAWSIAIGRIFLAFGGIEHVTIVCLRELPVDNLQKSIKKFRLAQRLDWLIEILEEYKGEPYSELLEVFTSARKLLDSRNLIAHNPLVLEFYERPDGTYFHQAVIAAMHKEKVITLDELQKLSDEAHELEVKAYTVSHKVIQFHKGR